jgi:hypothetical protein
MRPVPAECPRNRDGGAGPRACGLVACPYHLRAAGARGPAGAPRRVRLAVLQPHTCTLDVADVVRESGDLLDFEEIGALQGISRQAVEETFRSALGKLRALRRQLA